jgi:hypothetical protein
MTQPTCEGCRFWDAAPESANEFAREQSEIDEDTSRGSCRRRSPRVPRGEYLIADWPTTHNDDWCGEHQPKEEPCQPNRTNQPGIAGSVPSQKETTTGSVDRSTSLSSGATAAPSSSVEDRSAPPRPSAIDDAVGRMSAAVAEFDANPEVICGYGQDMARAWPSLRAAIDALREELKEERRLVERWLSSFRLADETLIEDTMRSIARRAREGQK